MLSIVDRCLRVAIGSLLVAAAIQITFGGSIVDDGAGFGVGVPATWTEIEHGWPMLALSRRVENEPTHRNAVWHGTLRFSPFAIAVDVVTFLLVAGTIGLTLFRGTSIGRHASVSLRSAALFTVLLAIVFADIGYSVRRCTRSMRAAALLEGRGVSIEYDYRGPLWLERLLGSRVDAWSSFIGPSEIGIYTITDDKVALLCNGLSTLGAIKVIRIDYSPLTTQGISHVLVCCDIKALRVFSAAGITLTDEQLRLLEKARALRYVFFDASGHSKEALSQLEALPFVNVVDEK